MEAGLESKIKLNTQGNREPKEGFKKGEMVDMVPDD